MVCTYFLQCTQGIRDFPEKLKQRMQKKFHRQQQSRLEANQHLLGGKTTLRG